jgi:hypothetical protein
MEKGDIRRRNLANLFTKTISGERNITNFKNSTFIESICDQKDAVVCLQRLLTSTNGIQSVQLSLRMDVTTKFFNSTAATFLEYLQAPELAVVCNGTFLRQMVVATVEPPIFWNALVEAQKNSRLQGKAIQCFAWLLLQLLSLPDDEAKKYYSTAKDPQIMKGLVDASEPKVRMLGHKIKHMIETVTRPDQPLKDGPGGRHDNDFADFRQISIVPTIDEILSDDSPFLRRAIEIEECPAPGRLAMHLDNQFRLLRENMLRSIREDLRSKKGQRIHELQLDGVKCGDRHPWSLQLKSVRDFKPLPKKSYKDRKKFLEDNRRFLANDSLACLLVNDDKLISLVTIDRDEDLLAQVPPVISIRFCGHVSSVTRSLLELKSAQKIDLLQLNTALFAYKPVLRQLQETKLMPLKDEILNWDQGQDMRHSRFSDSTMLVELVKSLQVDPSYDISNSLRLTSPTKLDESQARSLITAIVQRLSLIQGPPGMQV